jgi:hypothetical protein
MRERTTRALVGAVIVAFTLGTPVSSRAQLFAQLGGDAARDVVRVTPGLGPTAAPDVIPAAEQRRAVVIVVPAADQTQELRLRDGSRLYGRVVTIEADRILFRSVAGAEVQVAHTEILSLEVTKGRLVDGEFWPADSHASAWPSL